jgi:hypothetical protein
VRGRPAVNLDVHAWLRRLVMHHVCHSRPPNAGRFPAISRVSSMDLPQNLPPRPVASLPSLRTGT